MNRRGGRSMATLSKTDTSKNSSTGMTNNKARFKIEGETSPLYVQFNPESYSVQESVEYHRVAGAKVDKTVQQFVSSVKSVTSLSFYFDTDSVLAASASKSVAAQDVSALTEKFSGLMRVDGDLHRPPLVTFVWGSISVTGVITQMNTSFTMFTSQGMPVRAKVDCKLSSTGSGSALKRSPLQSPDRTKSRVMTADSSLWALAAREYGDINRWRVIARANSIMDPLDVEPGTQIQVPALTDL